MGEVAAEHLDGDRAPDGLVLAAVHLRHAAAPEQRSDDVAIRQARAGRQDIGEHGLGGHGPWHRSRSRAQSSTEGSPPGSSRTGRVVLRRRGSSVSGG